MLTQSRIVRRLTFAFVAAAALAASSSAQQVRDFSPTKSPARPTSGSCIYGGDGKLLYAPRAAVCPEMEQPPASATPALQPARAAAPAGDLRAEAAELLAERERLDVELARVREALTYEDRQVARRMVDEALRKLTQHLEREGRLLETLSAAPASPRP